jgi:hypothetical protein
MPHKGNDLMMNIHSQNHTIQVPEERSVEQEQGGGENWGRRGK